MSKGNRIKYIDYEYRENSVISVQKFYSTSYKCYYRVILDFENMQFYIRNELKKEFTKKSKKYGNLNVLKRNARKSLESLGVDLKKESRWRTFGVCEKGMTQDKWAKENINE